MFNESGIGFSTRGKTEMEAKMTAQELWKLIGNLPYENSKLEVLDSNGKPIKNIKVQDNKVILGAD